MEIPGKWGFALAAAAGLLTIFLVFPKGDKADGAQQLKEYAENYSDVQSEPQKNQEYNEEGGAQKSSGHRNELSNEEYKEADNPKGQENGSDGLEKAAGNVDALQEYMLRNTSQDNQEIIEQGETLKRELLRYLAAAYDREEMKEKAKEAYEELCRTEVQEELLEAAYLRRISLEMEQNQETALQTGKEAMQALPDSQPLAEKYLEILKSREGMTKEERQKELETVLEQFPALKSSKTCQELEQAYLTEGEKEDEEKNMPDGN